MDTVNVNEMDRKRMKKYFNNGYYLGIFHGLAIAIMVIIAIIVVAKL